MVSRLCAIAVLLLLAAGSFIPGPAVADSFARHFTPTNPPQPVPGIVFLDEKGTSLNLQDFRGRYILVNLWATWCGPCREELPALDALQNQFVLNRFSVLAIGEDSTGLTAVRAYYKTHGIAHLPLYADPSGRAPSLLQARGLPTSLLIAPDGTEIGRVEGAVDWGSADAVAFLEAKMTAYGNRPLVH